MLLFALAGSQQLTVDTKLGIRAGLRNLRPADQNRSAWTFNMVCFRIFVTQVRKQHCAKTKLRDL